MGEDFPFQILDLSLGGQKEGLSGDWMNWLHLFEHWRIGLCLIVFGSPLQT